LGQIKPGSSAPDLLTSLAPLGVAPSTGSLGFDSNGHLKLTSFGGHAWYDATLTANGSGTYNVSVGPSVDLSLGPSGFLNAEGLSYVAAGQPLFSNNSVLVADAGAGKVYAYQVNSNNDPVNSSQKLFMNLTDVAGMAVDPLTGDVLAITSQTGHLYDVRGFNAVPEPTSWTAIAGIVCLAGAAAHRRYGKKATAA
jgi:hypothetical protein